MNRILIISCLLILVLVSACTGTRRAAEKAPPGAELSAEEALRRVKARALKVESLSSNVDLSMKTEMFSGSVKAKAIMIKDSVIWLSASKLGFEIGRVMITRDSVFMFERLQRTYIKESFETLSDLAQFEFDFNFLQDFMLGNAVLAKDVNEVSYISKDSFLIIPKLGDVKVEHTIDNRDYRLLQTTVKDDATKMFATLKFEDYQALTELEIFSYFRSMTLDSGDEESSISLKFVNPEINVEKAIKFSIPPSYTARDF